MKKFLSIVIALALIFSLSACAKEPTAEELYTLAAEKNAATDKIDSVISMMGKMSIGAAGISQDIEFDINGSAKGENIGKEGMKMAMPMQVKMLGVSMDTNMYFADGWYLMEMAGQKVKCPMEVERALDQFTSIEIQPLDYVTLGDMTMDSDTKLYTIPYTMDMDKAIAMSSDALSMAGINPTDMEGLEWRDCTGTIEVDKNGNIKHQEATVSFSATMQGIEMECEMVLLVTYNEIAKDFSVSVPAASE